MADTLSSLDVVIRRGNNVPAVAWALVGEDDNPLPVSGRTFILAVRWRGGVIRKTTAASDGLALDAATSTLTWTPSLAESRAIPLGRLSRYEIELREGDLQVTIVAGSVTGVDSLNDD